MASFSSPVKASWRPVFLTLALLALVFRVIIPAGFMMGAGASGDFTIVICSPQGSHEVSVDFAGPKHKKSPDTQKHDSPCVFAGHGLADAPQLNLLAAPSSHSIEPAAPAIKFDLAPGRGLAAPPPPATGPPAFVI